MPNLDYSILIQIGNFILLLIFLNIIVYRPIRGILNKRKQEIESNEKITDEWTRKADKFSDEIEESMSETRKEGLNEKAGLKDEGHVKEKELLQEAYSLVDDKIEKMKKEIREKVNQARESLQSELEAFSHELAEKILGRSI